MGPTSERYTQQLYSGVNLCIDSQHLAHKPGTARGGASARDTDLHKQMEGGHMTPDTGDGVREVTLNTCEKTCNTEWNSDKLQ